jgi:hypothetical protein
MHVQPSAISMGATPRGGLAASTASTTAASTSTVLREVLLPSLRAASGHNANPAAAQAAADIAEALSRLEAADPGAGSAFVGNILTAAAAAPLAGGGEVQQLRQLADKLGTVTRAGVLPWCRTFVAFRKNGLMCVRAIDRQQTWLGCSPG